VPRARNIKPSLFKNEVLGEADPMLTLLFVGLWTLADREGRLEDRPKRIKAEIFPYREELDINGYLTELERLGFICRYSAENLALIEVCNFTKHQSPHKTERASELPKKPEKTAGCVASGQAPLDNGDSTVTKSLIPDSSNTDKGADKSAKFVAKHAEIPDCVDRQTWQEWCEYRTERGKPVSRKAATRQLNMLAKYSPEAQRRVVDHSIQNDYQGLFPPKSVAPVAAADKEVMV